MPPPKILVVFHFKMARKLIQLILFASILLVLTANAWEEPAFCRDPIQALLNNFCNLQRAKNPRWRPSPQDGSEISRATPRRPREAQLWSLWVSKPPRGLGGMREAKRISLDVGWILTDFDDSGSPGADSSEFQTSGPRIVLF